MRLLPPALAAATLLLFASIPAAAEPMRCSATAGDPKYVLSERAFVDAQRWTVNWSGSVPSGLDEDDIVAVVTASVAVWNAPACSSAELAVGQRVDDDDELARAEVRLVFDDREFPTGPGGARLFATSRSEPMDPVLPIRSVVIEMNLADYAWTVDGCGTGADLRGVVTHELGHALGLGHSADPRAVMRATVNVAQTSTMRLLHVDDVAGVCARHPCPSQTCGADEREWVDGALCAGASCDVIDGPCLPDGSGGRCGSMCRTDDDCAAGTRCSDAVLADGACASVCVAEPPPPAPADFIGRRCAADDACGGAMDRCAAVEERARFECGAACHPETPACPAGATCQRRFTVSGPESWQCILDTARHEPGGCCAVASGSSPSPAGVVLLAVTCLMAMRRTVRRDAAPAADVRAHPE